MLATKKFKVLSVNVVADNKKTQATNIQVNITVTEEQLLSMHQSIKKVLKGTTEADIMIKYQNVTDGEEPPIDPPVDPPVDPPTEDTEYILESMQGELRNIAMTDEEAYGPDFDGVGRTYILYWVDGEGAEHEVPMKDINEETVPANNPNGWYRYYSDSQYIDFQRFVVDAQKYILKKVK